MADITKIDAFVQSSPHPAWLATNRGDCLYVNPALQRLTGLKSGQVNQVDWRSFVVEEDRAAASASWQRSLASGTPYRTTVRLRGLDVVPATVELIAFGHTIDDGTELWLFTGLQVHGPTQPYPWPEAQLQATLNVIPAYTWYALPSGALTFVNERTGDYLGLPKDHPLRFGIDTGAEWDAHIPLLHPDDREESRRIWSICLQTGFARESNIRIRNAEGGYRWFLTQVEPLRASDGTVRYWIGVNLDIDERMRAEEQLVKSTQELQRSEFYLTEAQRRAHIGNWAFDPAKGFEYWSDELFRIHDLDPSQGPPDFEQYLATVHPQDRESMASLMKRMLLDGSGFDVTKRIVRKGGEVRYVRCVGTPISSNEASQRIGVGIDVTGHEILTQELRRREAYLAEAQRLGHVGSWVLVFEPIGAFEYWSDELFRIYGLDPGRNAPTLDEYLACVHPHDREFMASLIKQMIAEALGCDVTKRIVRPDGEVRHIRCVGAPVLENGTLKRVIGNAIDVTEHELLTRELQRREAYLAEAQRLSHTGSFGWNPDTGDLVWTDETYRIFEYDHATKPTLDMVVERIHPQDRALAQQVIDRASQTGTDFEHEYRLLLADGRLKHVHAIAHALQDSSGNREFIGAVTDITERKTAEEKIRSNENELRTLIEAIPAYVGTNRPDGSVDFISQSWLDYTGFSREQGMGWGWGSAIHPEDFDRVVKLAGRSGRRSSRRI